MHIDLRCDSKLYHALYSDVIAVDGRVYKLFKRFGQSSLDNRAATLFEAQCDAYKRAQLDPLLKLHIPEFFGVCSVETVLDQAGGDISGRYSLEACYAIEELPGLDKKVNDEDILNNCPHVQEIRKRFQTMSIDTGDASVFMYDDPERFKLIDFMSTNF
jgi:hypothetical protein